MRKLLFKNSFLSFVFLSFSVICFAQKQDRIWLFSDSSGIDFNDLLNPVAINSNITNPCLTSFASIADSNGQLLFYSAGVDLSFLSQRVYDKFGGLMENGDSLIGYPWGWARKHDNSNARGFRSVLFVHWSPTRSIWQFNTL